MSVSNLKLNILDKIISITDNNLLEKVNEIIGNVSLNNGSIKVSASQKQMLMQSEEDLIKGDLITDEDVNKEEDQWLKR